MSSTEATFENDPYDLLRALGHEKAVELVRRYRSRFTGGWFEALIDLEHPHEITAQDLLAVECLSVRVPAKVSYWILGEGREEIVELLSDERLRQNRELWECELADLDTSSPAAKLWTLLQRGAWPRKARANGVGPVIAGKLLAAKRPQMIPVVDRVVREALRAPEGRFWESMWRAMQRDELRRELEAIREDACREEATGKTRLPRRHPSLLRTLDIVVWMPGPRDPRTR